MAHQGLKPGDSSAAPTGLKHPLCRIPRVPLRYTLGYYRTAPPGPKESCPVSSTAGRRNDGERGLAELRPLATSDWAELERHRSEYAALGISLDQAASRFDGRHYPFGAAMAHVVGDWRTGENFHATNASLVEHDSNGKLQGYDYGELASLVRNRHQPGNPALARVLARDRNIRLTLDARLQVQAHEILERRLREARAERGRWS